MNHTLILHNIRSAENVGAIFRTAEAVGISKIFLCGYTPDPIDRFGRVRSDIHKSALGAEEFVSWEHAEDTAELLETLKKDDFKIVAIEQDEHSVDYKTVEISDKTAFVVGNEVEGISNDILSLCDIIAEIPMNGKKESLNVSVATGVALFRMLDR